ncbi:MAG: hypothetical protein JSS08_04565 [Proteobacteria bacterium]|nr:hypothetical protein [Pseudomonadota bacterium]
MVDQKAAFAERLKRISAGQQFEHADVVGHQTQKAYNRKFGDKAKKPRRSLLDRFMVLVAFLCGASAVLLGRLAYFQMSKITGLPQAFYDLQGRGMALCALILAMVLIVIFHLSTRARLQSLALGCLLMHFGEAAVASSEPQLYSQIFPPDYVRAMATQSAVQPSS